MMRTYHFTTWWFDSSYVKFTRLLSPTVLGVVLEHATPAIPANYFPKENGVNQKDFSSMCACCPALRSSSRQPVKRYKKLLAEIFPKSLPNSNRSNHKHEARRNQHSQQ
ncbi:hypothetical protein SO802_028371 [Lithocarpus litseifolius]|uniref:Uncharacterized protein n=1 Tax=Lithocarpus litseifolius TaxID=425828 RepID=A0AAW2BSC2_9ROSI